MGIRREEERMLCLGQGPESENWAMKKTLLCDGIDTGGTFIMKRLSQQP